jgi:superfamily II DNA or RNA helicase
MIPNTKDIEPRDYQKDAYLAIKNAIGDYRGAFFIEASVGAGKTIIMGMVLARIQELKRRALVLARAGELVEQNAETFSACGVFNSIYSASLGIKSTHRAVVVGTEGTIANALKAGAELEKFSVDFLIIDECHEVNYSEESSQYMQIISALIERNPNLKIIGLTGTPYRGADSIIGEFWQSCVYRINSDFLVGKGFLVPDVFGLGDDSGIKYDLKKWAIEAEGGRDDYTKAQLEEMDDFICESEELTRDIVAKILHHTEHRNVTLITGAGLRHLKQVAKYLPVDSWGIVTSEICLTSAGEAKRGDILKAAYTGKIKNLLQVGCLITGVDIPLIDTSVIMRKIASLRILVQLLGRGKRLLKPSQEAAGFIKSDHLILDYTQTLDEMHELYSNPILENAAFSKSEKREGELITCPACATLNTKSARRCRGVGEIGVLMPQRNIKNFSIDGRCEFFWDFVECKKCGTPNDKMARQCRSCEAVLIDPAANLSGKHYTDNDWREVKEMFVRATNNGQGLIVDYVLAGEAQEGAKTTNYFNSKLETATELLWPEKREKWAMALFRKWLADHVPQGWRATLVSASAGKIVKQRAMIDTPALITHRLNKDGRSVISRKQFLSGRECKDL